MADGGDARRAVDLEAAVVVAGEVGFARMEPDSNADGRLGRPGFREHRPLDRDGRRQRRAGIAERREHRIALRADDGAARADDGLPNQVELAVVQRIPAGSQRAGMPHRPFDVGPKEGDRARRQVETCDGHRANPTRC
jgi:hypothetical protein